MRDALSQVLGARDEDRGTDRILAAAFFRERPRSPRDVAGARNVILLADRKRPRAQTTTSSFLGGDR